jgi:hypothetical protein
MSKCRIQYLSNLFLNKTPQTLASVLKPCAPILALCGNIGVANCPSTRDFLKEVDNQYERVLWIPGMLEYATSDAANPVTWKEQADKCYKSIQTWNLKHTTFCQKYELNLTNNYSILATPLWDTIEPFDEYKLYQYKIDKRVEMNTKNFSTLFYDEYDWIQSCINKNSSKKIILSYSPIHSLEKNNPVLYNLFGKDRFENPSSYSGGSMPWIAINVYGSKTFRKDAFVEISK